MQLRNSRNTRKQEASLGDKRRVTADENQFAFLEKEHGFVTDRGREKVSLLLRFNGKDLHPAVVREPRQFLGIRLADQQRLNGFGLRHEID